MPTEQDGQVEPMEALRVYVENMGGEREQSADWGSWQTFIAGLGASNTPQQILPQNNKRKQAAIFVSAAAAATSISAGPSNTTSPGALQTLVSAVLPAGTYTVNWLIGLGGGTSATEVNNVQLVLGSTIIEVSTNGSTSGSTYTQNPVQIVVPAGGATLLIQTINAGTVGAVYRAEFTATATGSGYVLVGTRGQVMNGQGGRLIAGSANRFPIENKQELWMAGDGATASIVTVLDERYE